MVRFFTTYIFYGLLVVIAGVMPLASAKAGDVNASLRATVVDSLDVVETESLHFGSIVPNSGGTVLVAPGSTLTTGALQSVSPGRTGKMKVSGSPGTFYLLFKGNGAPFTLSNGNGDSMQASIVSFVSFGLLGGSGTATHEVSANLTVNANQAQGVYIGTYPVTVNFF